jgi:hypothetical protein
VIKLNLVNENIPVNMKNMLILVNPVAGTENVIDARYKIGRTAHPKHNKITKVRPVSEKKEENIIVIQKFIVFPRQKHQEYFHILSRYF